LSDGTYSNFTIIVTYSDGNASNTLAVTTFIVDTTTGRTAIAAGSYHTCAILKNASVKCWEYNNKGQLDIDNTTNMGNDSGEMDLPLGIDL
jgi:alpha-tubulin suppressor-like RCC1 family protein